MTDPATGRTVWCEHALLPDGVGNDVLLTLESGRITHVAARSKAPADAEVLPGLTLPGFANAHSHAFHRALRGRTHGGPGDFWTWRERMYSVAAQLTPDNYLALARATFAEMVLAGYTVVGEFHYVHHQAGGEPYRDPNVMGRAIVAAAADAGVRLTVLDTCYLRGGPGLPLSVDQQRFGDGSAERWGERVDSLADTCGGGALVRVGAAIHSVRAVDAASIDTVAAFANARNMPLHAHVSEQPAENDQISTEHGLTPTELLSRHGALSERFTAVHATHLTAHDVQLHAAAHCTCCLCPTTERDLADGIGPSTQLAAAGVRLCIGSDQHAVIDPFEEIRAIETDERLRSLRRGNHAPLALLAAGSAGGYASLGWHEGGRIAIGALADLTTVGLDSVRLAGWSAAALPDAVVFAATGADVRHVVVGGRTIVRDGRHCTIDVPHELTRSIAAVSGPDR